MNEEFSGRGPGTRARENRGWELWERFGRWERKGQVMGVLKGWKAGEIGENCDPPQDFNVKGESTRTTRFHFKTKEFILTRFSTLAILPY